MTSRVIMQFMWGYQEHFRLAFQRLASESLGSLAPTLKIRSLLVGVKSPNAIAHHLVCVEPETGEVPQSLLDGLEKRIQELIASHELQNVFYGDEPSNRDKPRRIREACVRDAVAERLSPFDSTAGIRSFCSLPTVVGSYEVVCVIQVEVNAFNSMPQLRRTTTWHEDFRVVPSLAHAVIECLLEEAHDALYKPEPGRTVRRTFAMDGEGVVLRAAKEFSYTPSWAGKRTDAMGELSSHAVASPPGSTNAEMRRPPCSSLLVTILRSNNWLNWSDRYLFEQHDGRARFFRCRRRVSSRSAMVRPCSDSVGLKVTTIP